MSRKCDLCAAPDAEPAADMNLCVPCLDHLVARAVERPAPDCLRSEVADTVLEGDTDLDRIFREAGLGHFLEDLGGSD